MLDIRPSTHPGVILREEFATPLNLTQAKLSEDLNVGIKTLSELYNEKRGITSLMALKLAEYFGTTPHFWMNLQNAYDLYKTYEKEKNNIKNIAHCAA
ncbi:HigA family addiction module antidote protein [Sulfurimonas lithotrophica]|uniref:HigA family addiction module antidote protein n=1 Tax=Sulfurimonas lithotrophica TaxID=2590022 RepID=A0A5P8P010_9BACT|nr:HigA family addiction module antitoxin [Sulfurimonas lithotrophica]QFR49042.1 HigA family addiction module antidote protein [Sulfurimonas lithotrophica]